MIISEKKRVTNGLIETLPAPKELIIWHMLVCLVNHHGTLIIGILVEMNYIPDFLQVHVDVYTPVYV